MTLANVFLGGVQPAARISYGRRSRAPGITSYKNGYTRATQRAATIGQGMAILFGFIGLHGKPMLIFIALFVWIGARQEASVVQMKSALAGIPLRQSDAYALSNVDADEHARRRGRFSVDWLTAGLSGGSKRADRGHADSKRPGKGLTRSGRTAPVSDNMRECLTAEASEMLETVLARLQGRDCHTIPVLEHGALIGLVTMDNV